MKFKIEIMVDKQIVEEYESQHSSMETCEQIMLLTTNRKGNFMYRIKCLDNGKSMVGMHLDMYI